MLAHATAIRAVCLVAVAFLFCGPDSHAQFNVFITGQVVDPLGVGVPGVDIDVDNMNGGGDPNLLNDGTDAGGFFTTTVEESGSFNFIFNPPAPPITTLLLKTLPEMSVGIGINSLGVISLEEGVDVQGTCVGPTGLPAGNVNFDIYDADGNLLDIPGAFTSLFGTFRFVAPAGPAEWRFNTLGVISETLAPTVLDVTFAGASMNLGNVVLPRGYHFNVTLLRPTGLPLALTDTDVFDSATGDLVYTPGDNSNAAGLVDLVLAAGTYDLFVCPTVSTGLVATGVTNFPLTANVNVGSFMLVTGVLLSGVVRDNLNQPLQGVNIDMEDSFGNDIFLCGDSSTANGSYSLIVPMGVWRLEYNPSFALPLGASIQDNVVINGNKVNNVVLPACPTHTPFGTGLAGSGGIVPTLSASGGSARFGNPNYALEISGGLGKAPALIVSGFKTASTPFHGGTLLVANTIPPFPQPTGRAQGGIGGVGAFGTQLVSPVPSSSIPLVIGVQPVFLDGLRGIAGTGSLTYPQPIPSDPALVGFSRFVQVIVADSNAVQALALSNGIAIDFCE